MTKILWGFKDFRCSEDQSQTTFDIGPQTSLAQALKVSAVETHSHTCCAPQTARAARYPLPL